MLIHPPCLSIDQPITLHTEDFSFYPLLLHLAQTFLHLLESTTTMMSPYDIIHEIILLPTVTALNYSDPCRPVVPSPRHWTVIL